MSKIYRGEMQDNLGNTIYPHTEAGLVYCSDGETVQEKLTGTAETLDGITGVSDSTELDDSTKLATSKAVNTLRSNVNSSLTADNAQQFQFAYDSESGKYGYKAKVEGADTFFPFKNCELKKATVPAFTGVTKSVSTDGKAHVIMLAICSGDGNTTYNLFAIYSDGEYGDSFTINRGSEPGKTGTFIQNVTDSGFTINLGVSNIVNSAICYYIT